MKSFEEFLIEASDPKKTSNPSSTSKPKKRSTGLIIPGQQISDGPNKVSEDYVSTLGRFNPLHRGHEKLLKKTIDIGKSLGDQSPADVEFHMSKSQDPKKNPLPFQRKLHWADRQYPEFSKYWNRDPQLRTIIDAAVTAHQKGYKNFHFVGGQDRYKGIEDLMRRYNNQLYQFNNIYGHNAGNRNEASDDPIEKLSASKQRGFAEKGDFEKYLLGERLSKNFTMKDAREKMLEVAKFGIKNENWTLYAPDNKTLLYERYKNKELFNINDIVEHDVTGLVGRVHRCGANHVICLTEEGVCFKSFVHQLSHLNT